MRTSQKGGSIVKNTLALSRWARSMLENKGSWNPSPLGIETVLLLITVKVRSHAVAILMIRQIAAPLVTLSFKHQISSSVHIRRPRSTLTASQLNAITDKVARAKKWGENVNIPSRIFNITHHEKRRGDTTTTLRVRLSSLQVYMPSILHPAVKAHPDYNKFSNEIVIKFSTNRTNLGGNESECRRKLREMLRDMTEQAIPQILSGKAGKDTKSRTPKQKNEKNKRSHKGLYGIIDPNRNTLKRR